MYMFEDPVIIVTLEAGGSPIPDYRKIFVFNIGYRNLYLRDLIEAIVAETKVEKHYLKYLEDVKLALLNLQPERSAELHSGEILYLSNQTHIRFSSGHEYILHY